MEEADMYTLEEAFYGEGRIVAKYAGHDYMGTGYEGEAVYEKRKNVRGDADDVVTVKFYARHIEVEKESGNRYSGTGSPDKTALERAYGSVSPLDVEDVEQFEEEVAKRNMKNVITAMGGETLETVSEDVRLQLSATVNGKDITVVYAPEKP